MATSNVRPLPVRKAPSTPFVEIGRTGLLQSAGFVREEFQPALQGRRASRVWREMMDNDPIVGAFLFAIDMQVRQVEWYINGAGTGGQSERWRNHVEESLHDMSATWEATLSSVLSFLPYGWSFHEILYKSRQGDTDDPTTRSKYDDGLIGWRKFPVRAQESLVRWDFDPRSGSLRGMQQYTQGVGGGAVTIPMEKALLFRTTAARENPEGRSVLRNAYRPWLFKKRIEEIEGIGIERDLAGLPVAKIPPEYMADTATPAQKAVLEIVRGIVRDIKRDDQEGIVWPLAYNDKGVETFKLELLTTGGRRQFDTDAIIARYDQRIAMTVLSDFLLLGHEKVGSYQLGVAKVDLWSIALGAWLDEVMSVFNEFAIPRLMRLNGVKPDYWPTLAHDEIQEIDLTKMAQFLTACAQAGMPLFPDIMLENYLRIVAGWPERAIEAAVGGGNAADPANPEPAGGVPAADGATPPADDAVKPEL